MTVVEAIQLSGMLGLFFIYILLASALVLAAADAYARCRSDLDRQVILLDVLLYGFVLALLVTLWAQYVHWTVL